MNFRRYEIIAALVLTALGCDDPATPTGVEQIVAALDTTVVPFYGNVDIIAGTRKFGNVRVIGILHYELSWEDPADTLGKGFAGLSRLHVFIHTDMKFVRSADYQGISQKWRAGGKSGDVVDLAGGEATELTKLYKIWAIPNEAYIAMRFRVTPGGVRVTGLWITYDFIDKP